MRRWLCLVLWRRRITPKTLRVTLSRVGSSTRFSIIQDTSNKAPLILLPTFERSFAFRIKPSVLQLEKTTISCIAIDLLDNAPYLQLKMLKVSSGKDCLVVSEQESDWKNFLIFKSCDFLQNLQKVGDGVLSHDLLLLDDQVLLGFSGFHREKAVLFQLSWCL